MNSVRSGFRGHVDRTRRGKFGRHIQARLSDLKFLDSAGGNVGGSGADGFVRDVNTIYFDTCRAAVTAAERDGGVTCLGGIEVLAILNLYAGFELREVKEVATIHRQVFDLAGGQNTLHRCLFGVDLHFAGLHFNHCAFLADLELDAAVGGVIHFDIQGQLRCLEALCLDPHLINTRVQCTESVFPCRIAGGVKSLPGRTRGGNLSVRQDRASGIRHVALNTSGRNRRLRKHQRRATQGKQGHQNQHEIEAGGVELQHIKPSFWGRSLQNSSLRDVFLNSPQTKMPTKTLLQNGFTTMSCWSKAIFPPAYCALCIQQIILICQLVTATCSLRGGTRRAIATAENPKNRIFNL